MMLMVSPRCTCRMSPVDSATIDPPYLILDEWCPIHGKDPDEELQKKRDDYGEDYYDGNYYDD